MTWAMYDGLAAACAAIDANTIVRVAVLRGAGARLSLPGPILLSSASKSVKSQLLAKNFAPVIFAHFVGCGP